MSGNKEGFCLMQYECDDCRNVEVIWNSRDGVTPFIVGCAREGCAGQATHVRWNEDQSRPDYMPPIGSRIFVDLTLDRAKQKAKATALNYWDRYPPSREQFATVDDLAEMLAGEYVNGVPEGSPDLIVVAG